MHGIGRVDVHKVAHVAEEERRRAEGEEMLLQRPQQKQIAQAAEQQAGDHPKRRRVGKGEVRQRDDRHQRDLRRLAQIVIAAPAADEVHDGERRQKHREQPFQYDHLIILPISDRKISGSTQVYTPFIDTVPYRNYNGCDTQPSMTIDRISSHPVWKGVRPCSII